MLYRLSTHVVVNSTSVRDLLVQRDGLPEDKIRILSNGVDVDRFSTARRDRQALLPAVVGPAKLIAVVAHSYLRGKGHPRLVPAATPISPPFPYTPFPLLVRGP